MSYYAALDGVMGGQVATVTGWGDFTRWVDSLDAKTYPDLVHLADYGWDQDMPNVQEQLSAALKAVPPEAEDVRDVAAELLGVLAARGEAEVLSIGDGLVAARG